jgi:hypothetical protein
VKALIYKKRDLLDTMQQPDDEEGEGEGEEDGGRLECIGGFDITKKETYPDLTSVQQMCLVVGGSRSDLEEDKYSPFNAEALGVKALLEHFKDSRDRSTTTNNNNNSYKEVKLIDFGHDKRLEWSPLNDTIMGGNSRSEAFYSALGSERNTLNWTGELAFADGGFCGVRSSSIEQVGNIDGNVDVDCFDGIKFTCLGDGQRYKMSIRTRETSDRPESSFQCQFEAPRDEWTQVKLKFEDFVAVNQTVVQDGASQLVPSEMLTLGLVLSRFSFNGLSNPSVREGKFLLQLKGGVSLFKEERPSVVLVSSAAVERNQTITSEEQRLKDIPIVQLNPRKILNAKYLGETYVRGSGLNYCVVRPTGLKQEAVEDSNNKANAGEEEEEEKTFCLELSQGDTIAGTILRDEVAEVVSTVAQTSYGNNTTFEIASRESAVKNLDPGTILKRQFRKLVPDHERTLRGISPFPKPDDIPGED